MAISMEDRPILPRENNPHSGHTFA